MKENPFLVSIIVPVYNVEIYIERCVVSMLAQSYSAIEYIFVDDCSRDQSLTVLMNVLGNYPDQQEKVTVLRHNLNKGAAAARNTGLQAAKGEYIYFLDSDDEITPNCIEQLVGLVYKHGAELVQGNFKSIPAGWCSHHIDHYNGSEFSTDRDWIVTALLSGNVLPMMACNRLIHRNLILGNALYFKEGFMHEDDHWNFFLSKCLASIAICKEHTYMYYKNPTGVMNSPMNKKFSVESSKAVLKDWVKYVGSTHTKTELDFIFRRAFMYYESSEFRDFEFLSLLTPLFNNSISYFSLRALYIFRVKFFLPTFLSVTLSKVILKLEKRTW